MQAGEQVMPGWHVHVARHSQVGPQAQDKPLAAPGPVELKAETFSIAFI